MRSLGFVVVVLVAAAAAEAQQAVRLAPPAPVPPGAAPAAAPPPAAGQPAATPSPAKPAVTGPSVSTVYDEVIAGKVAGIEDGQLVLAVEPSRRVPLDEVAVIDFDNKPTLAAEWVGQDNHDVAQVGGAAGASGIQDLHVRLRGLPIDRPIKQIVVATNRKHGRGVWRLDTKRTPNWKLVMERPAGSDVAELYFEPDSPDSFGHELNVTLTYDDGATAKTTVTVGTHTSDKAKFSADGAAPVAAENDTGPPSVIAYAQDRSVLHGHLLELTDESLTLRTAWGAEPKLALVQLRGIAFPASASPDARRQFDARLGAPAAEDSAIVAARDAGISTITGSAHGLTEGKLRFTYEGAERTINQSRVAGLVFAAQPRRHTGAQAYQVVRLLAGDELVGVVRSIDEQELSVETACAGIVTVPRAAVGKVLFRNGKMAYLSDLEPASIEEVPYFSRVFGFQRDHTLEGGTLSLKGKQYPKGLAVHSRSVLTYAIDGGYVSFKALLGFDDAAKKRGRVAVRVLGDGRELFADLDFRGDAEPKPLDVPVAGVKQLTLEVDFGRNEDIGDRVVWADARIFREGHKEKEPPPPATPAAAETKPDASKPAEPSKPADAAKPADVAKPAADAEPAKPVAGDKPSDGDKKQPPN